MLPPITNADPGDETAELGTWTEPELLMMADEELSDHERHVRGQDELAEHHPGCGAFGSCDCPAGSNA